MEMLAVDKAILEDVEETSATHAVDEANVALAKSELKSDLRLDNCF